MVDGVEVPTNVSITAYVLIALAETDRVTGVCNDILRHILNKSYNVFIVFNSSLELLIIL